MVVFYHAQIVTDETGPFSRGYLFVDFFFLLSGFVLTLAAEGAMKLEGGAGRFLVARIARLWPTIAIGALIGASVRILLTGQSVKAQLAQALLLVPDLRHGGLIFPLNGPHWSMLLEVIANLAHALVLRRLPDRAVLAVAAMGGLALVMEIGFHGSATFGPDQANWWLGFARIGFSYPLGVWLARQWKRGAPRPAAPWGPALALPLAAVLIIALLPVPTAFGDAVLIVIVFPPLLWLAAAADPPRAMRPWLHGAGALSFPLYAVHLPILQLGARLHLPGPPGIGAIPACLLVAALVAQVPALPRAWPLRRANRSPAAPAR